MKKIVAFVLSLLMICTLVSCSSQKETEEEKKSGGTDLSTLDGEFLYRHGEEKMKALKSALYTTKVLDGEEELGEFETVRIRKGYDGFQYSRRGQGFYSFDGERAYTENDLGAFTAPTTLRVFEEYLTNYVFPVCGLSSLPPTKMSRSPSSKASSRMPPRSSATSIPVTASRPWSLLTGKRSS